MRIPWDYGTISDSTKIALSQNAARVYELIFMNQITDDFSSLANWTEVDADGKVNLSGGIVTMDGTNTYGTHGLTLTSGVARNPGYFEIEFMLDAANSISLMIHANNSSTLPNAQSVAGALSLACPLSNQLVVYYGTTSQYVANGMAFTPGVWYRLRQYINTSYDGTSWRRARTTLYGGTQFTEETEVCRSEWIPTEVSATIYFQMQRYRSDASAKINFRKFRWYCCYATDAPYVTYLCDAGADKKIYGLNFANVALPSGISSTNLEFDYSFDDGTPSYSSKYTLAQLQALGAISGAHRYLRIRVYANSNGSTQVYVAPINSDDMITTIGSISSITPRIDSISPNVGSVDGGTTVTISGEGLSLLTGVTFDGVAGTDLSIASDTSATIKTPAGDAGQGDVVGGFTGYSDYTLPNGFTYQSGASTPGAITVSAKNVSYRRIKVSWQGGAGFTIYTLYRDDVEIYSTSTKNEYTDTVAIDTSYTYKIVASNDIGDSESSYTIKSWTAYDVPDSTPVGEMLASIRSAILEIKESDEYVFEDANVQVGQIYNMDNRDNSGFPCVEIYPGGRKNAGDDYESQRTIAGSQTYEIWLHVKKTTDDRNSGADMISMSKIGSAIIRQMYSFIDRKTDDYPCKGFIMTNPQYEEMPVYEMLSNLINSDGITISFRVDNEDTQL